MISQETETGNNGIETTGEEIDGYNIVKAILREIVDVGRVAMRDKKSYCGILLDDNNRKPICRLYFNSRNKYIGLFSDGSEEKVSIESLDDIFQHSDRIQSIISKYDKSAIQPAGAPP